MFILITLLRKPVPHSKHLKDVHLTRPVQTVSIKTSEHHRQHYILIDNAGVVREHLSSDFGRQKSCTPVVYYTPTIRKYNIYSVTYWKTKNKAKHTQNRHSMLVN